MSARVSELLFPAVHLRDLSGVGDAPYTRRPAAAQAGADRGVFQFTAAMETSLEPYEKKPLDAPAEQFVQERSQSKDIQTCRSHEEGYFVVKHLIPPGSG